MHQAASNIKRQTQAWSDEKKSQRGHKCMLVWLVVVVKKIAPAAASELGAGTHAPLAASPAFPSCSRLVKAAMPETKEAVVPATPPRALLTTACPPSSGKRGPSRSRSSASSGSSGGRPSPPIDADGFQLVLGRMRKGRSGAKIPKKARERERGGSL